MEFYQQGDVLMKPSKIPASSEATKGNVLQEGEHTGHAHRLYGDGFTVFENPKTKQKHLRVVKTTALRHEEHKEIGVPPGDYEISIVKEYDHFEEETRNVLD